MFHFFFLFKYLFWRNDFSGPLVFLLFILSLRDMFGLKQQLFSIFWRDLIYGHWLVFLFSWTSEKGDVTGCSLSFIFPRNHINKFHCRCGTNELTSIWNIDAHQMLDIVIVRCFCFFFQKLHVYFIASNLLFVVTFFFRS